jgi:hypothetical protein
LSAHSIAKGRCAVHAALHPRLPSFVTAMVPASGLAFMTLMTDFVTFSVAFTQMKIGQT